MKRTSWPIFVLSFLLAVIDPVVNKAQALYPISENGKWGLMDASGATIVPAIYSSAETVGFSLVEIGLPVGKGLIDRNGKEVLPPRYAEINVQRDSIVWYREGNRWGYLHLPTGNILPPLYDKPSGYFENKTVLKITGTCPRSEAGCEEKILSSCISYDAKVLVPPTEYDISQCYDTRDLVRLESADHRYGFWDVASGRNFAPEYQEVNLLSGLRFAVRKEKDAPFQLIDMDGKVLSERKFDKISNTFDGWIQFRIGQQEGLINPTNDILTKGNWERIMFIDEETVGFQENQLWGLVKADGKVLFPPQFASMAGIDDDLIWVKKSAGESGFLEGIVSTRGDTVIPIAARKVRALSYGPGFAVEEAAGGWTFYNNFGIASEVQNFSEISDYQNGLSLIRKEKLVGMMNLRGEIVVPAEYDKIEVRAGMVYAVNQEREKIFPFDENGELLHGNHFILVRGDESVGGNNGRWQQLLDAGWFQYPRTAKWGLKNTQSDSLVLPPRYDRVQIIGNTGLSMTEVSVQDYLRFGLVDHGRLRKAIDPVLRELHWEDYLQGNVARVTLQNGRRTIMSRKGKIMHSDHLRYVGKFVSGKARIMLDGKLKWEKRTDVDALEMRTVEEDGRRVNEGLYAYQGKWAIIDGNGKWLCKPEYDFVSDFDNGLALVMKDGKWGALDTNMQTVVELEWNYLARLGNAPGSPLIAGRADGNTGYVSVDGQTITGANHDGLGFENGRDYSQGLAAVQREGKWGFIDQRGRIQIPFQFDAAGDFHEGMAWVSKGRTVYFIDTQGVLTETEKGVYRTGDFHDSLAWANANGRFGYLDQTGRWAIQAQYFDAGDFCHGLAIVREKSGRGMIDVQGNEVVKTRYQKIFPFENGMAIVRHNRRYGCIDSTGEVIVKPHFLKIEPFREGLAQVKTNSWRGFINQQGEVVIKGKYRQLADFSGGMAAVREKDRWGYLNKKGEMAIAPEYIIARDFGGGLAAAYERGRWHLIDTTGQDLVHPREHFSSLTAFSDGMSVARSDKGWWYYMDSLGNDYGRLRGEPIEGVVPFSNGIGQVQVRGGWRLVNRAMQPIMAANFKHPVSFNEGLGRVQFGMKYGMIAADGTVLLEPRYDQMKKMGNVIQVGEGANLGYVNADGTWLRR